MDICTGSEYYHVRLVTSRTDFLKSHIQDSNAMQDVKCAWLLGFARLLGVAWCRNSIDFLHLPTDIALSSKLDPENWKTLPKCYSTPRCCDFMSYSKVYQLSSNWYLPSKHHVLVKITRTVQPLRIALHLFVTLGSTCAWVKVEIALPSVLMSIAMDFDPGNLCFFLRSYSVSFRKPNELLCWANLLRSESPTMEFFFHVLRSEAIPFVFEDPDLKYLNFPSFGTAECCNLHSVLPAAEALWFYARILYR